MKLLFLINSVVLFLSCSFRETSYIQAKNHYFEQITNLHIGPVFIASLAPEEVSEKESLTEGVYSVEAVTVSGIHLSASLILSGSEEILLILSSEGKFLVKHK